MPSLKTAYLDTGLTSADPPARLAPVTGGADFAVPVLPGEPVLVIAGLAGVTAGWAAGVLALSAPAPATTEEDAVVLAGDGALAFELLAGEATLVVTA